MMLIKLLSFQVTIKIGVTGQCASVDKRMVQSGRWMVVIFTINKARFLGRASIKIIALLGYQNFTNTALKNLGYKVFLAANGKEAFELIKKKKSKVNLVELFPKNWSI